MAHNEKKSPLKSERHISDRMFIKSLKDYGELTHDDLIKIFNDYDENPLMIDDKKVIDSMYVGKGVGLCLCYKKNGREYECSNQSIEDYDYDDIKKMYDYIVNN